MKRQRSTKSLFVFLLTVAVVSFSTLTAAVAQKPGASEGGSSGQSAGPSDAQIKDAQTKAGNDIDGLVSAYKKSNKQEDKDAITKYGDKISGDPKLKDVSCYMIGKWLNSISPNNQDWMSQDEWCKLWCKFRGSGGPCEGAKDGAGASDWQRVDGFAKPNKPKTNVPKEFQSKGCDCGPPPPKKGVRIRTGICPQGEQPINDMLDANPNVSVDLIGDGVTTSSGQLLLTNNASGQTTSVDMPTMCMSRKTQKPWPTLEEARRIGLHWHVGGTAPNAVTNRVLAARTLESQHKLDSAPIPAAGRAATVGQLTVWKHLGENSADPRDKITEGSLRADLLTRSHVDPSSLTRAENADLNNRVASLFESVNFTDKFAETMPPPSTQQPEPPSTGTPETPSTGTPETPGQPQKPEKPPTECCIPPFTEFIPDNPEFQTACNTDMCKVQPPVDTTEIANRTTETQPEDQMDETPVDVGEGDDGEGTGDEPLQDVTPPVNIVDPEIDLVPDIIGDIGPPPPHEELSPQLSKFLAEAEQNLYSHPAPKTPEQDKEDFMEAVLTGLMNPWAAMDKYINQEPANWPGVDTKVEQPTLPPSEVFTPSPDSTPNPNLEYM